MQTTTERLSLAPPAQPGMLRGLGLALLAHALLLAALTWGVQWRRDAQTLAVEAELWAAVPVEAAPPPAPPEPEPTPTPAPPPQPAPPPPPEDAQIALERARAQARQRQAELEAERNARLAREKAQQALRQKERLAQEQQALKAKKAQEKLAQEKTLAEQRKKDQAVQDRKQAQQLEALRKQNLQRMAGLAGANGAANATGTALRSAGPSASYAGRLRARVKPNIVFTDSVAGNPAAEVEVRTAPDGTIVGRRVVRSSGVPEWDDAVLKALDKTQVLPRDTDGRVPPTLLLVFRPNE